MQEINNIAKQTDDENVLLAAETSVDLAEIEVASTEAIVKPTKKSTRSTAKKASAKPKTSADKTTSTTKKTLKTTFFIQHDGKEVEDKDIISRIKEIWVSQLGKKLTEMKSLTTYIKPEEQSIYYVINDDVTGRIDF